jgi:hypothetical protein
MVCGQPTFFKKMSLSPKKAETVNMNALSITGVQSCHVWRQRAQSLAPKPRLRQGICFKIGQEMRKKVYRSAFPLPGDGE